jgi:cell division transport system permease protein
MKMIKLWRTFREGANNYRRNGWLTVATVSVLTLSLFVISLTGLVGFAGHLALHNLEEKISISASFKTDVSESRILAIKEELEQYKEIASVRYISREQALDDFLADGDQVFAEAVAEIGENPLLSSLVIKATEPRHYDLVARELESSAYEDEIEHINYERNKKTIDALGDLTDRVRNIGLLIGGVLALIAILITFNTIRLTIYSHRQEFEVMRLVGASNLYIKMPFFFEGIFYGLSAALITVLLLGGVAYGLSENIGGLFAEMLGDKSFFNVFLSFLWVFVPSTIIISIILGVVSSLIAIRRYLRV